MINYNKNFYYHIHNLINKTFKIIRVLEFKYKNKNKNR